MTLQTSTYAICKFLKEEGITEKWLGFHDHDHPDATLDITIEDGDPMYPHYKDDVINEMAEGEMPEHHITYLMYWMYEQGYIDCGKYIVYQR